MHVPSRALTQWLGRAVFQRRHHSLKNACSFGVRTHSHESFFAGYTQANNLAELPFIARLLIVAPYGCFITKLHTPFCAGNSQQSCPSAGRINHAVHLRRPFVEFFGAHLGLRNKKPGTKESERAFQTANSPLFL